MVIEGIGSIGRWAAALAIALAVAAPAVLSAAEGNSPSDQPVVSAPATPVTAGPDEAPAASPASAPATTRPASEQPAAATTTTPEATTATTEPAPAPVAASPDKPSGMSAATTQVKFGASQIAEGKVLTGTGELGKGVGNTIVEGTRATGRGVVRVGQVTGYGIQRAWNTSFDAVIDAGDATVNFVKGMFGF